MSPLRARLIAAGVLRPWAKELLPIQLPPGTVVFRVQAPRVRTLSEFSEWQIGDRVTWSQAS